MNVITGAEAAQKKKGNMAMWDSIDGTTEDFIKDLAKYSSKEINTEELEEEIIAIGKDVTELVIKSLEKLGAEFVYADCNY